MNRRQLLQTGLAMGALAASPLSAAPKIPKYDVPEKYLPRYVTLRVDLPAYQIHLLPDEFALYWTLPDRKAIRYTCGIGRPGLYEPGEYYVGAKKEFPSWTPTPEMIERDPASYAKYKDGLEGSLSNPLGARALYLFQPGRGDTFLRIHGTDKPNTIGRAVSNGCARLVNDQIADLYERVPLETRVKLYHKMGT
ncbi:L,D-transpeptidase [Oceaniglobus roseus]|uniref:L,D-transpeptidase n=1 Tax=Oceaniglobus roseus TaxID=1737570 RepID=UPI000C7ECA19|nr:L,D-transpeptidase [Kandeliimicrobium roseum]